MTRPEPSVPTLPSPVRASEAAFLLLALVLPWTIAPMGIAAGLCAAATLVALARGVPRARTPVDLAAPFWAAALVLSALFAVDRAGSLPRLGKALFPLLVPLVATCARREATGRRATAVVLVSAVIAALFGLVLFVMKGATFASRARGAVGHYMTFGGQLMVFLALAIGIAIAARERRWRLGALAAAVPLALGLGATFTRSAWIGLVVALAVMLGAVRPKWLPALAVLVVLGVVFAPAPIRSRLTGLFDPMNDFNRERTYMWQAGARMFRDHPVTGVGLMDLHPLYERYRSPQAVERAGHLHSIPVQIAATMGAIGLAAFAMLYASLFAAAAMGLRASLRAGGVGAGIRLGMTGALAGFLVAGLFEWNFGDEELLYPLYTLVGLAWAARGWTPPERGA